MYQTITNNTFHDAFHTAGRGDQFSYEGRNALFDYLEEYEGSTGEKVEVDVVALCCEFTEYADIAEFQAAYDNEYQTMQDVADRTIVIPMCNGESFIAADF